MRIFDVTKDISKMFTLHYKFHTNFFEKFCGEKRKNLPDLDRFFVLNLLKYN